MNKRLTRTTKAGKIVINEEAFPEYDPVTIYTETSCFDPITAVIEKLYEYEERFENV